MPFNALSNSVSSHKSSTKIILKFISIPIPNLMRIPSQEWTTSRRNTKISSPMETQTFKNCHNLILFSIALFQSTMPVWELRSNPRKNKTCSISFSKKTWTRHLKRLIILRPNSILMCLKSSLYNMELQIHLPKITNSKVISKQTLIKM